MSDYRTSIKGHINPHWQCFKCLHHHVINFNNALCSERDCGCYMPVGQKITLCGSTKFSKAYAFWNKELTLLGNIVYSVAYMGHSDKVPPTDEEKVLLDLVHKEKIYQSDEIFVLNVSGYIGDSTRSELEYAREHKKILRFLVDEWTRGVKYKNLHS